MVGLARLREAVNVIWRKTRTSFRLSHAEESEGPSGPSRGTGHLESQAQLLQTAAGTNGGRGPRGVLGEEKRGGRESRAERDPGLLPASPV